MKNTTKKKKEKKLLQVMKIATDQCSDGIVITNAKVQEIKAKIIYTNEAFCKMTGYTYTELVGKTLSKLHGSKTDPKVLAQRRAALSSGHSFNGKLIKYRKNGSEFYNECDAAPVFDSNGEITNYIYIMKDVTERVNFEEKKEEIISVVSHEIKTPLTAINGFVEILKKKLAENSPEKNRKYLSIIKTEVDRLTGLTGELLETTRIKNRGVKPVKKLTDLDEIIRQVIKNVKITASGHKISRRGRIGILVNCDKNRIKQVITNLLTNAIQYSPEAEQVLVHITRQNNHAIVSVQDYGVGIPREKQKNIFEHYYRTADNNLAVSTGLGLYISAEIIRSHGGDIWVESAEGKGSIFSFSLPVS